MNFLSDIPDGALQWVFIAVVFLAFSFRSHLNYRHTKNPVSLFYAIIMVITGVSYLFWSIPAMVSSGDVVRYANMVGDALIAIPIGAQSILLWLLVLKAKRISKWVVIVPALIFTIWAAITSVVGAISGDNFAYISDSNELVQSNLPGVLSVLFLFLFVPLAVNFLKAAILAQNTTEKLRSSALGMTYLGLAVVEIQVISFSDFSYSQETERFLIVSVVAIFAVLFLVVAQFTKKR